MAFGDSATLKDDFNRANEGPPPSANWTDIANGMKVVSNTCRGNAGSAQNVSFWDVATFGADCECYITITTKGVNSTTSELYIRMTTLVGATTDGYCVKVTVASGTDTVQIFRLDNGATTQLGATINQEFSNGDKLGIDCIGSAIAAHRYNAGAWAQLGSRTDATYGAAGYVGLGSVHTDTVLDDFFAGTKITGRTTKNTDIAPLGIRPGISRRITQPVLHASRKFFIPESLGKIIVPGREAVHELNALR